MKENNMNKFNKAYHSLQLIDYEKNGEFIKTAVDKMVETLKKDHEIMAEIVEKSETDLVNEAREETKLANKQIEKLQAKLTEGMSAEEVKTAFEYYHRHLCYSVNNTEYAVNISNLMLAHVPTWEVKCTPIGITRVLKCSCGMLIFDRSEVL